MGFCCRFAAIVGLASLFASAWAWKPTTHVFLAETAIADALDDVSAGVYDQLFMNQIGEHTAE